MTITNMTAADSTDAELVALSRAGNRDAFGRIVSRYQSLICSLAYSATGCLGHSEDLAQETFITAWTSLRHLREPQKLRAWLCGIARNCINSFLRRECHEPAAAAEPLEVVPETFAPEPLPPERAINREEEAILWRALERLPENYRGPLVLFYREGQSVEQTASLLELSEDAVKQRLARGRKLLTDEVAAFVESALKQSAPGRAFTLGVLASLPVFATTASAATAATAAAKGGAAVTSATLLTVLGAVVGPVIGALGAWLGYRASLNNTRTPCERQFVVRRTKMVAAVVLAFMVVLAAFIFMAPALWKTHPVAVTIIGGGVILGYVLAILIMALRYSRAFRALRQEERSLHPEAFADDAAKSAAQFYEYRSRASLLGLPLVHIRTGTRPGEKGRPALGWVAIGDVAVGVLFAFGGIAVGGVSIGGLSLGLCALGGCGFGLVSCAGVALGLWTLGGVAVGWLAGGGLAVAWKAAFGGVAIAHDFALGGAGLAAHFNDAAARAFMQDDAFLSTAKALLDRGVFQWLCWLPLCLVFWPVLRARRAARTRK